MLKRAASLLLLLCFILVAWKWTALGPTQPPLSFTEAESILASQWSPSEAHLFLLHKKGKLTIYDVERDTYRQIQTTANPQYNEDYSLFQSPDGKFVGVASFIHSNIVLEIYETASGNKTKHLTLPVSAKHLQSIKAKWHPTKNMILVSYTNEEYLPGVLQAVDLNHGKLYPIIHNTEDFSFSRSNLVILTSRPGVPSPTLSLHVTPANSFKTMPVRIDNSKGKIRGFAANDRGLYFTQRRVSGKTEKITANFWRNEVGHLEPAWANAFQFPARHDGWQDEIVPATDNEWVAVTIIFGTDGMSGGQIWCVNKDKAIRMTRSNPNAYQMYPYGWQSRTLLYNEASNLKTTSVWTDFRFDTTTNHRTVLPNAELQEGSWGSTSPRLKHMAIFRKEKEVAPWQLFIRPLDWCAKH